MFHLFHPARRVVARLDALASRPPARLQAPAHGAQGSVMERIDPQELPFDSIDPQELPFDSEVAESPGPIARDEPDDQPAPAPRTALECLVTALRRR